MTDAAVARFIHYVQEMCSDRATDAPPAYAMRDHLTARMHRELVALTPQQEARVISAIRKSTGA
jgi:hypothetical protein